MGSPAPQPGQIITVFRSRAAQKAGRAGYYIEYSIAVGTIERAGSWTR